MPRRSNRSSRPARTVGRLRLIAQQLIRSPAATPADAVRALLAMQAQDLEGALWSIGLRTPGARRTDVNQAFAAGEIVRSWPLRGTLHVTAAEDLPWMLAAFAPRVIEATVARREGLGLDGRTLGRARDIAVASLSGGRAQTRAGLRAAFAAGGVKADGPRGYHLLFHLSLTGTLCSGPPADEPTFVLLAEWVREPRRLERDEALGELARRYFESHGPATLQDLAGWAKVTAADARRGVEIGGGELATLELDGVRYLLGAGTEDALADTATESESLALPGFDEYMLGYKDRAAVLAPAFSDRIVPGGNGVFRPTVVVDGQIVGVWRRKKTARGVVITAEPFSKLSRAAQDAFSDAVELYGRFLGVPAAWA